MSQNACETIPHRLGRWCGRVIDTVKNAVELGFTRICGKIYRGIHFRRNLLIQFIKGFIIHFTARDQRLPGLHDWVTKSSLRFLGVIAIGRFVHAGMTIEPIAIYDQKPGFAGIGIADQITGDLGHGFNVAAVDLSAFKAKWRCPLWRSGAAVALSIRVPMPY